MRKKTYTTRFKRNLKLLKRRNCDLSLLLDLIDRVGSSELTRQRFRASCVNRRRVEPSVRTCVNYQRWGLWGAAVLPRSVAFARGEPSSPASSPSTKPKAQGLRSRAVEVGRGWRSETGRRGSRVDEARRKRDKEAYSPTKYRAVDRPATCGSGDTSNGAGRDRPEDPPRTH